MKAKEMNKDIRAAINKKRLRSSRTMRRQLLHIFKMAADRNAGRKEKESA